MHTTDFGPKNITAGVSSIEIDIHSDNRERLILPNGVYVPCGERPPINVLRAMGRSVGVDESGLLERHIPDDQDTSDVIIGPIMTYGISPVSGKDFNSDHVNNCMVVAAVGIDAESNDPCAQQGLYAHVNPAALLATPNVKIDLQRRIEELRKKTHQFTRDVVFLGGGIEIEGNEQRTRKKIQLWINLVQSLENACKSLDVEPTVMFPELEHRDTSICLETQNRKVLMRPKIGLETALPSEHFPPFILASKAKAKMEELLGCLRWKK